MFNFRRIPFLVVLFTIIVAVSSVASVAQTPQAEEKPVLPYKEGAALISPREALERDAMSYAADYGVELSKALWRLQLQNAVGKLNAELLAKEQKTFAGLWIQHTPQYRIVASFTHGGEETLRPYVAGGPLADIVELRTADMTLAELKDVQDQAMRTVSALDIPAESGINLPENKVELYVTEAVQLEAALGEAKVQLPDNVEIIEVNALSSPDADIYGGLSLGSCTSGFSVKDAGNPDLHPYITTAGHCPDELSYNGEDLTWVDEEYEGSYDIQIHSSDKFIYQPWFFDGTDNRTVLDTKGRDEQMVGDYVCKYGKTTGYTCGDIKGKNYRLTGVPNSAGTWIKVRNQNGSVLALGGDSGGPWFSGNTAYGIHHGHNDAGTNAFYMAINYVSGIGVEVLLVDRACGDVDRSVGLSTSDAAYLAKHVIGRPGYERLYGPGDVDREDGLSMSDAIYLAKHIVGQSGYETLHCDKN